VKKRAIESESTSYNETTVHIVPVISFQKHRVSVLSCNPFIDEAGRLLKNDDVQVQRREWRTVNSHR